MQKKQGNATWNANLPIRRRAAKAPANREICVPNTGHRGWNSRGYLPHFDGTVTQAVTLHLGDSLPKEALERMQKQVEQMPEEERNDERRQIEGFANAGYGSCILRNPAIAQMVQESLHSFHQQRYILRAWVVMPNHIHVLFRPLNGWSLNKIIASWKKFTARKIGDHCRQQIGQLAIHSPQRNANLPIRSPSLPRNANLPIRRRPSDNPPANQEICVPSPVWHPEFWDRYMRDELHFQQSRNYIHRNPVKAGLVKYPEDWPWSSAAPRNANLLICRPPKSPSGV